MSESMTLFALCGGVVIVGLWFADLISTLHHDDQERQKDQDHAR